MSFLSSARNSSLVTALRSAIPDDFVNRGKHLPMAVLANLWYGFPSRKLTIIGVTGTDGKTTTSTMLYHILHSAGFKVALISTVSAKMGTEEIDTGFHVTSPDHFPLQRLLKKIYDKGYTHVVLETTSHGFAQHRLWGVQFAGGIVTNITEDHLDYHKTWEAYALAKAQLFKETRFAVLNKEDKSFEFLKKKVAGKVITYGFKEGEVNLNNTRVNVPMLGTYNKLNGLAALAAALELGVGKEKALQALALFPSVRGRMQVMYDQAFMVVVDFAHTPNALKVALKELRHYLSAKRKTQNAKQGGRIIAIFGCAGLRDANRRKMGYEAAKGADLTIITAEDPRTEGVEKISEEIASWARKGGAVENERPHPNPCLPAGTALLKGEGITPPVFLRIPDRQEAIDFGVEIARKGDIVGVFGKGHERSMCFGTKEIPWTDQKAVKKALNKLRK